MKLANLRIDRSDGKPREKQPSPEKVSANSNCQVGNDASHMKKSVRIIESMNNEPLLKKPEQTASETMHEFKLANLRIDRSDGKPREKQPSPEKASANSNGHSRDWNCPQYNSSAVSLHLARNSSDQSSIC